MYVVTLRRFARRQSDLTDSELQELWICGLDSIAALHESGLATNTEQDDGIPALARLEVETDIQV